MFWATAAERQVKWYSLTLADSSATTLSVSVRTVLALDSSSRNVDTNKPSRQQRRDQRRSPRRCLTPPDGDTVGVIEHSMGFRLQRRPKRAAARFRKLLLPSQRCNPEERPVRRHDKGNGGLEEIKRGEANRRVWDVLFLLFITEQDEREKKKHTIRVKGRSKSPFSHKMELMCGQKWLQRAVSWRFCVRETVTGL